MQSIDAVQLVASSLGELVDRVVFVGGASLPFLVTDPGAAPARPTLDVDLLIEVATSAKYWGSLREELLAKGFREDTSPGAPRCRWVIDGLEVDVMPTDEEVLGLRGAWFKAAMDSRFPHELPSGIRIWVVSAPVFLATKLEAFRDRGAGDYQASHDLEDLLAVVDGRKTIEAEVAGADAVVRNHLVSEIKRLLGTEEFLEAVPGHFRGDVASQARVPGLIDRLRRITT